MARTLTFWVPIIAVATAASAVTVDVTICGQVVPRGADAQLVSDLACPDGAGPGQPANVAVQLERGASLALNGFTLSGADIGVQCQGRCEIAGPGTIRGFALGVVGGRTVKVHDLLVENTGQSALQAHRLRVNDTDVVGNGGTAILANALIAERVTVSDCWYGVQANRRARVADLSVVGCGQRGIGGRRIRGERVTATGNGDAAVVMDAVVLFDSVLTGNGTLGSGIDIRSRRSPRLSGTSCGRSESLETGLPFGVCEND